MSDHDIEAPDVNLVVANCLIHVDVFPTVEGA